MSVKLEGVGAFKLLVEAQKLQTATEIDKIIKTGVESIYRDMQNMTPVDTGFLKRSEGYKRIGIAKWKIFAKADYAGFVEEYYVRRYGISWWSANIQRGVDIINFKIENYLRGGGQ